MHAYDREGEVKPQGPLGVGESRVRMGKTDQWSGGEQGGNGRDGPVGGGRLGMGEAPSSLCTSLKIILYNQKILSVFFLGFICLTLEKSILLLLVIDIYLV